MIGAAVVAELEDNRVGAGAQLYGEAAGAEGVVVAEVEVFVVYAQARGRRPRRGGGLRWCLRGRGGCSVRGRRRHRFCPRRGPRGERGG